MKKNFIKFTIFIAIAFFTSNAIAQSEQGDKELGADFRLGIGASKDAPNMLIGGSFKGRFTLIDNFRLDVNLSRMTSFGKLKDLVDTELYSSLELCTDFHYIYDLTYGFFVYPLAGVGGVLVTDSRVSDDWGYALVVNAGAGIQFMYDDTWGFSLETKYKKFIGDEPFGYINLSLGVILKL